MIGLFEIGTVWFWVLISILGAVFIAVQENSPSPGSWTTFGVILSFVALYFCGAGLSIKELGVHIYHYPVETLAYFLLYIVAGTIWSFFKWGFYVNALVTQFNEQLRDRSKQWYGFKNPMDRPKVSKNQAKLFNWIFYWPFSLVWFVVHEPIERIFNVIMTHTRKTYEAITERAFRRVHITPDESK